ncbi:Alpha/Beta hydrolase protein, partial [Blyttiomyces helicus]
MKSSVILFTAAAAAAAASAPPQLLRQDQSPLDEPTLNALSVHTLAAFPQHSLRVREDVKLCDEGVQQIVGYLDVTHKTHVKHFFFWFFESRKEPSTDPLLLWLNGGPGCSSSLGLLVELGPCRVGGLKRGGVRVAPGGNGTIPNPHSWTEEANVIFLDQPAGVGFSYTESSGEIINNSDDAAADTFAFLQLFLTRYKK